MEPLVEFNVGQPVKQCAGAPFWRQGERAGVVMRYADMGDVQPHPQGIRRPTDTLKVGAFSLSGEKLWAADLGPGMPAGLWFCPVFPFDLDGDGEDEVYCIGSTDPEHPFHSGRKVLEQRAIATGEVLRTVPWPDVNNNQGSTTIFRNFVNGGYSNGRARFITAQGTYNDQHLQCWDADFNPLWNRMYRRWDPGSLGSHMFPVIDLDGDGRDEVLWGEHCLDIDTGEELWCADRDGWTGHSDIVMPTLDHNRGEWLIYTCREFPAEGRGVVMFDSAGRELWGHRGMEHVHSGWTARLGEDGTHYCHALELDHEKTGSKREDHFYDIEGRELEPPEHVRHTLPVDFDGDGRHELIQPRPEEKRTVVLDRHGVETASCEAGANVFAGKLLDHPGEQILSSRPDGTMRIYGHPDAAADSPEAKRRYAHPYYTAASRLRMVGYNWRNLGGV